MSFVPKKTMKDTPKKDEEAAVLAENVYKKNIELLSKNKTLSLLGELYEIGILTLNPKELATRISGAIQNDLSFEFVQIFTFEEKSDSLIPLAFSKSEKLQSVLKKLALILENTVISNLIKRNFFKEVIYLKKEGRTNDIKKVWGNFLAPKDLKILIAEAGMKTIILLPLLVESRMLGGIMVGLNRDYDTLNEFEKESIKNLANVVALALEKAFLYQELQNANEQLRELDHQKDELLGIIVHQLATPVSSVRWNLEMMADGDLGKLTKEQEESIKSLQGVTENLSDLVSMILDVSRIQLGRMKVDPQELDLNTFFKEILAIIEPKAKEKKVQFHVSIPKKFPKAMLDKRYTHMTIENLLSNAVKYTPEGGNVDFDITIKNNVMHCIVKDTGVGIPEKEQDKIFGKMYRASNVQNTIDGNGFGLYVAKGATEAQGGKIWFESVEGKGTTFFVELPLSDKIISKK